MNYSLLSRAQLEEALTRIDRVRFPMNYDNLVKELQTRPAEAEVARAHRDLRNWIRYLGWYQLIATGLLTYNTLSSGVLDVSALRDVPQLPRSSVVAIIAVTLVMLILLTTTAIAGFLSVRGHKLGPHFSIASFGAQVISVTLPGFAYQYLPLLALQVYWSNAKFGVNAVLGPNSTITVGGSDPLRIAVDVLSIAAIALLVKFIRQRPAS